MNSGDTKIKHTEKPSTALLGHYSICLLSDLQIPLLGPWRGTTWFVLGMRELADTCRAGLQLGTSGCSASLAQPGCCPTCSGAGGAGDAAKHGRAEQEPRVFLEPRTCCRVRRLRCNGQAGRKANSPWRTSTSSSVSKQPSTGLCDPHAAFWVLALFV